MTRQPALSLCLALALPACLGHVGDEGSAGGGADADPGQPSPDADPGSPTPDAAPGDGADAAPTALPGDDVELIVYDELNSQTDSSWGGVLTDIVQHCPPEWVSTYYDSDKVTHGHETSHGIHANLRNNYNDTGERANGLYLLEDRAAIVVEPDIRKSAVAPFVPQSLRGFRYSTYITGQTAWDDTPLYVWDEWNAYVNGTAVAVDLVESGLWSYGWRDACAGTIEFVPYALALGMAVEDGDPGYFSDYDQFRELLAWNIRRSMSLYLACADLSEFEFDEQEQLYADLRTNADAAALRDFVVRTYGASFAGDVLGF